MIKLVMYPFPCYVKNSNIFLKTVEQIIYTLPGHNITGGKQHCLNKQEQIHYSAAGLIPADWYKQTAAKDF